MAALWPFIALFAYAIVVEVFINIRLNKLQHAIRATIIANTKSFEQGEEIFKKYASPSFREMIGAIDKLDPHYLRTALMQRRRTAGLRLICHIIGVVAVFVWIGLV